MIRIPLLQNYSQRSKLYFPKYNFPYSTSKLIRMYIITSLLKNLEHLYLGSMDKNILMDVQIHLYPLLYDSMGEIYNMKLHLCWCLTLNNVNFENINLGVILYLILFYVCYIRGLVRKREWKRETSLHLIINWLKHMLQHMRDEQCFWRYPRPYPYTSNLFAPWCRSICNNTSVTVWFKSSHLPFLTFVRVI